jgi:hypothetical protein
VSAVTRPWELSALVSDRALSLFELILHIARDTVLNMRISQKRNFHAYNSGTKGQTVLLYRRNLSPSDCHQITALKPKKKKFFFFFWRNSPQWAMDSSFTRFLDHTQRHTTVGRTPLDEWSTRRRDLYLTTHNTYTRQTSMPPVGFEPTISTGERPQTYALECAATGTGGAQYLWPRI